MITVADWKLGYEGFAPEEEGLREALCTLGNGYFATRGAAEEASADEVHYPGTYLAGGFNRLQTDIAGRVIENEDLVNLPNWLPLSFRPADGDWLNLQRDEVIDYRQELDLRSGFCAVGSSCATRPAARRRSRAAGWCTCTTRIWRRVQMTIKPENWSGNVEVMSALDGRVINFGVARYRSLNSKHLEPLETPPVRRRRHAAGRGDQPVAAQDR